MDGLWWWNITLPSLPPLEPTPTATPNATNGTVDFCKNTDTVNLLVHISLGPAAAIMLVLSLLQQRKYMRECLNGRPGIAVPVNFLDDYEHRWSYAVAFGAVTNTIVVLFSNGTYFDRRESVLAYIGYGILGVLEISLLFYPYFACLTTSYRLLGSIIGLLYCFQWLAIKVTQLAQCPNPQPDVVPFMPVVQQIPSLSCLFFLCGKYVMLIIQSIRTKTYVIKKNEDEIAVPHQVNHVKELLKPQMHREKLPLKMRLQKLFNKRIAVHDSVHENKNDFKTKNDPECPQQQLDHFLEKIIDANPTLDKLNAIKKADTEKVGEENLDKTTLEREASQHEQKKGEITEMKSKLNALGSKTSLLADTNEDTIVCESQQKQEQEEPVPLRQRWDDFIISCGINPHFMFSARIISVMTVVLSLTYQLAIVTIWIVGGAIKTARDNVERNIVSRNLTDNSTYVRNTRAVLDMLYGSWIVITVVCLLFFVGSILVILSNYKHHTLRLYKGDRSFFPDYTPKTAELLAHGMKYAGYQVAHMVWAFFVLHAVLWLFALIVIFILVLPAMNQNYKILEFLYQLMLIPLVTNVILFWGQTLASKFIFLQAKLNDEDKDQPLALTNRRLFHNFTYYLFLANIPMGLVSCLMRIVKGAFYGILLLGRIDITVMMKGFERKDRGFISYIGLLHTEVMHNHPVLRVFCQLMLEGQKHNTRNITDEERIGRDVEKEQRRRRGLHRWQLAYTLINNPTVIDFRKCRRMTKLSHVVDDSKDVDDSTPSLYRQRADTSLIEVYDFTEHKLRAQVRMRQEGDSISVAARATSVDYGLVLYDETKKKSPPVAIVHSFNKTVVANNEVKKMSLEPIPSAIASKDTDELHTKDSNTSVGMVTTGLAGGSCARTNMAAVEIPKAFDNFSTSTTRDVEAIAHISSEIKCSKDDADIRLYNDHVQSHEQLPSISNENTEPTQNCSREFQTDNHVSHVYVTDDAMTTAEACANSADMTSSSHPKHFHKEDDKYIYRTVSDGDATTIQVQTKSNDDFNGKSTKGNSDEDTVTESTDL